MRAIDLDFIFLLLLLFEQLLVANLFNNKLFNSKKIPIFSSDHQVRDLQPHNHKNKNNCPSCSVSTPVHSILVIPKDPIQMVFSAFLSKNVLDPMAFLKEGEEGKNEDK